jgi:ribosomal protein L39E
MTKHYQKKVKLGVAGRQTKWAPIWVLLRKFGRGSARFHHVSEMTKVKRHWKKTKLKIKPRKTGKKHLG